MGRQAGSLAAAGWHQARRACAAAGAQMLAVAGEQGRVERMRHRGGRGQPLCAVGLPARSGGERLCGEQCVKLNSRFVSSLPAAAAVCSTTAAGLRAMPLQLMNSSLLSTSGQADGGITFTGCAGGVAPTARAAPRQREPGSCSPCCAMYVKTHSSGMPRATAACFQQPAGCQAPRCTRRRG